MHFEVVSLHSLIKKMMDNTRPRTKKYSQIQCCLLKKEEKRISLKTVPLQSGTTRWYEGGRTEAYDKMIGKLNAKREDIEKFT